MNDRQQRILRRNGFMYADAMLTTVIAVVAVLGLTMMITTALGRMHEATIRDTILQYTIAAMEQGKADYRKQGTATLPNHDTHREEGYRTEPTITPDEIKGETVKRLTVRGYYQDELYCTLTTILWDERTMTPHATAAASL